LRQTYTAQRVPVQVGHKSVLVLVEVQKQGNFSVSPVSSESNITLH
jgi:hypothetical protein